MQTAGCAQSWFVAQKKRSLGGAVGGSVQAWNPKAAQEESKKQAKSRCVGGFLMMKIPEVSV